MEPHSPYISLFHRVAECTLGCMHVSFTQKLKKHIILGYSIGFILYMDKFGSWYI